MVSPVSVLLLVAVAALVGGDGENDPYEASVDIYEQSVQALKQHESMYLADLHRAKKKKPSKKKPNKKKPNKKKPNKKKPNKKKPSKKCKTEAACKKAKGKCTTTKECKGKMEVDKTATKKGCSKNCVCCIKKRKPITKPPITKPPTTAKPTTDFWGGWFDCDNGRQVPGIWKCDGVDDCGDSSDEVKCETCADGEMMCPNRLCIREMWKCDGFDDCGDGSDEADCDVLPWTFPPTEGPTGSTDGATGNDSIVIHKTCAGFKCKNEKCIIASWKCDGWDDCGDNSDEEGCNACASSQFTCKSDGKCIRGDWKCDKIKDCADGSDESDCKVECKSDQFQCVSSGRCISGTWKCDNYKDCTDNSDEKDCQKCDPPSKFECKNKNCISSKLKCDGKNDCGDESDEENCPTKCQCGVPNTKRIIGGTEVNPKRKFPWQIGLQNPGYYISCGGTIINDRWILTAAHCITDRNTCRLTVDSSSPLKVLVGEHKQYDTTDDVSDTKKYSVKTYIKHPDYNCRSLDYDFALLELTEPIPFNNVIRPICLPKDDSKAYAGETGTLTGWGKISNRRQMSSNERQMSSNERQMSSNERQMSTFLRTVQVPILANDKCGDWGTAAAMKICAGGEEGKGSCGGDSGGPLHIEQGNKYVQVGVVSYGHRSGCATSTYPTVYARVSKVLDWITTTAANGKKCN